MVKNNSHKVIHLIQKLNKIQTQVVIRIVLIYRK